VNSLVDRFAAAQKMMKQMRSGGGMPKGMAVPQGMALPAGVPAGVGGGKPQNPKKKSRSGNPAKRAAQEGR
jgi:signal recognition particle subunit SRP54